MTHRFGLALPSTKYSYQVSAVRLYTQYQRGTSHQSDEEISTDPELTLDGQWS